VEHAGATEADVGRGASAGFQRPRSGSRRGVNFRVRPRPVLRNVRSAVSGSEVRFPSSTHREKSTLGRHALPHQSSYPDLCGSSPKLAIEASLLDFFEMANNADELALDHVFWNGFRSNDKFRREFVSRTKFRSRNLELLPDEKWHHRWYKDPQTGKESETDITLFLRDVDSGERFAIHIENKPAHRSWEPDQAANYRKRALNRQAKWQHSDHQVALIAPASFIANCCDGEAKDFDLAVPYELIGLHLPEFAEAAKLLAPELTPLATLRVHLLSRTILEENLSRWPWLAQVRLGIFAAIPSTLDWKGSHGLAYLIDGYELAGQRLWEGANERLAQAEGTGNWRGDSLSLWLSLFVEHRRYYFHGGYDPSPGEFQLYDGLCRTLREMLIEDATAGA